MEIRNRKNTILSWLILLLGCGKAQAQLTLDWDIYGTSDWAYGAMEGTFSNIEASGIDLFVVVHGDVFKLGNDRPRIRPVDETRPNGEQFLQFGNFDFSRSGTDSISVSLSFYETGTTNPVSVASVSFQMIDVNESSEFNDRISFSGSPILSEVVVSQNRSLPEHDMSGALVQAWDGTGSVSADRVYETVLNDFEGAMQVEYGAVNSLSFTFDCGPGAPVNPAAQDIGIYDIAFTSFTPVPEPATVGVMLAGSFFFLFFVSITVLL